VRKILDAIREDLSKGSDEATRHSFQRFFKEPVKCYGLKNSAVGAISKKHFKAVSSWGKNAIFDLCEALFSSGFCEEAFIASNWLPRISGRFEKGDLKIFRRWIDLYVNNWATCDTFCNHTVGALIERYPDLVFEIKDWALSENRWLKRASAVSLIVPAKRGMFLKEAFEISDLLISDPDDMVQKGYGWLLKEESRLHQREVLDYVLKNRDRMPRIALRYAVELMPKELRSEAMKKI